MTDAVTTEIIVKISGAREAQQQLSGVASAQAKIKTGAKDVTAAQKELSSETRQAGGLIQSMTSKIGSFFNAVIGKSKTADGTIADLNKGLKDTEEQAKSAAEAVANAGQQGSGESTASKLDRGLGTVERFAGSLGSSAVNQAAGVAGDALATGQALAGVGAGLGTILTYAAPVALILVGVSKGLELVQDQATKAQESLKSSYEAAIKDAEQSIQNRDLARTKTTQQNQQDISDLQKDIDDYGRVLSDLRDKRAAVDKAYSDLGSSFNPVARSNLGAQGKELDTEIAATRAKLDELDRQFQNTTITLAPAIKAHEDEAAAIKAKTDAINASIAAEDKIAQTQISNSRLIRSGTSDQVKEMIAGIGDQIRAASDELNNLQGISEPTDEVKAKIAVLTGLLSDLAAQSRDLTLNVLPVIQARERETEALKKQKDALDQAGKAADEYAQNSARIKDIEQSRVALIERRARDDSRAAQVSALEAKISAAKEIEAEQERGAKIVSLRRDASSKESSAVANNEDAKRKVNDAFMRDSLKALKDYQLAESRATQEYSLSRVRKLEDLYDDLSSIAASGDVSSFIRTQRQGLKDVRRGDQDFGIASQQRAQDFDLQRQAAQQARDQQLADLRQGLEQQRAAIRDNLAQQIQQEQEAGKSRLTQSAILEQQLQALKQQFAAEDQVRTRREEDAQIASQIAAIRKRNDEIRPLIAKAIDPFVSGVKSFASGVGDSVVGLINRIRSAASGSSTPRPRPTGTLALANAEGGIYDKPTVGVLGERAGWADAVIGYKQSEGFVPALMRQMQQAGAALNRFGGAGGGGNVVYLTINAGDLVDKAALEELKQDVVGGISDAKVILTGSNA